MLQVFQVPPFCQNEEFLCLILGNFSSVLSQTWAYDEYLLSAKVRCEDLLLAAQSRERRREGRGGEERGEEGRTGRGGEAESGAEGRRGEQRKCPVAGSELTEGRYRFLREDPRVRPCSQRLQLS